MDPQPPNVTQASLFQRPREKIAELKGAIMLMGRRSLELPMFCRLVALEFHSVLSPLTDKASLRIELMPAKEPHLRVQMFFRNVRDMRLQGLPADGLPMTFFAVENVQALGWAEVNWKIGEVVSNAADPITGEMPQPAIEFYAEEAEVVSVVYEG
jgi:hypothetical protein